MKWRDNKTKVDKNPLHLGTLYKSVHMVLGSGGSDETKWKPGLRVLIISSPVIIPHRMAFFVEG